MQIIRFQTGQLPELAGTPPAHEEERVFYWLDVQRSERDWHESARPWLRMRLHERHVLDSLNDIHPPYFDYTKDYGLLVVRALCPDCPEESPTTRAVAFIVSNHVLVSIRPSGDPAFDRLGHRFLSGQGNVSSSAPMLLYLLIDQLLDTLLARRDVTSALMSRWQDRLLDPNDVFTAWQAMMRLRSHLRRLAVVSEGQIDALSEWREQTQLGIDAHPPVSGYLSCP